MFSPDVSLALDYNKIAKLLLIREATKLDECRGPKVALEKMQEKHRLGL